MLLASRSWRGGRVQQSRVRRAGVYHRTGEQDATRGIPGAHGLRSAEDVAHGRQQPRAGRGRRGGAVVMDAAWPGCSCAHGHARCSTIRGRAWRWNSVNDLARFVRMHLNNGELDGVRILKRVGDRDADSAGTAVAAEGFNEGSLAYSRFGIGWAVERYLGHECFWHSGGMPGVSNMVRVFPENQSAVIVLTNTDDRTMARETALRDRECWWETGRWCGGRGGSGGRGAEFAGTWQGRRAFTERCRRGWWCGRREATLALGNRAAVDVRRVEFRGELLYGDCQAMLRTRSYHGLAPLRHGCGEEIGSQGSRWQMWARLFGLSRLYGVGEGEWTVSPFHPDRPGGLSY